MLTQKQLPQYQFTQEGFAKITQEQLDLQKERELAVDDLAKARNLGDLSENGYYKSARAKLSSVDSRLRHLNKMIKYAKIISKSNSNKVSFGCQVTVGDGKTERNFQIVGKEEANPMQGKISSDSPLGRALMGKEKGEKVKINVVAGIFEYKIINIS